MPTRKEIIDALVKDLKSIKKFSDGDLSFLKTQPTQTLEQTHQKISECSADMQIAVSVKVLKQLLVQFFKQKHQQFFYIHFSNPKLYFINFIQGNNFEAQVISIHLQEEDVRGEFKNQSFFFCVSTQTFFDDIKQILTQTAPVCMNFAFKSSVDSQPTTLQFTNQICMTHEYINYAAMCLKEEERLTETISRVKNKGEECVYFNDAVIASMFKVPKSQNMNFIYSRHDDDVKITLNDADYEVDKVVQKIEKSDMHVVEQEFSINSSFQIIAGMKGLVYHVGEENCVFSVQYGIVTQNQVFVYYLFKM